MKKKSIGWLLIFVACSPFIHSQTTKSDLCSFLSKIESNAATNFRSINEHKTDPINDHFSSMVYISDYQYTSTNLVLAGSRHCYIANLDTTSIYNAVIPITLEEEIAARKETEEFKNKILSCLSNYTVKSYLERMTPAYQNLSPEDIVAKYEFRKKTTTGGASPVFVLLLTDFRGFGEKDYHDYTIYLTVTGTEIHKKNNKTASPGVVKITNEKKELSFTQQLLELLDHAKDGFQSIRGEKTDTKKYTDPWKTSVTNHYKTNYLLRGAKENNIEEYYMNEKYTQNPESKFVALYGKELSKTEGEDLYEQLSAQLKQEFTSGFDIKEFKDDYPRGGYVKFLYIKKSDDKNRLISIEISNISGDKATVKIAVK